MRWKASEISKLENSKRESWSSKDTILGIGEMKPAHISNDRAKKDGEIVATKQINNNRKICANSKYSMPFHRRVSMTKQKQQHQQRPVARKRTNNYTPTITQKSDTFMECARAVDPTVHICFRFGCFFLSRSFFLFSLSCLTFLACNVYCCMLRALDSAGLIQQN